MRYPYPLEFYLYRTIGSHNGFWQTAVGIRRIGSFMSTYTQHMAGTEFVHLMAHPPGNVLYIWLWRSVFEVLPGAAHALAQYFRAYNCQALWFVQLEDAQIASTLGQMTIPMLSGLTVVPLYQLGKRVIGSRAGFRAAALYIVVPSLTLFTVRWDQLYPFLLCLSLLWLHIGLESGRSGFCFLAGLSASVASFMSFGNLTIVLALGAYGLVYTRFAGPGSWSKRLEQTWRAWILLPLGAASIWTAYHAASGMSFWQVFSTAMRTHLHLGRSYWLWIWWNLYDFLTFLGIPVAVFFIAETFRAVRMAVKGEEELPREGLMAVAVGTTLLVVDLSGVVRGEVGRMWLLWMSVACLLAAVRLTRRNRRLQFSLILVLMVVQTLLFTLFVRVDATGMPRFEPRHPNTTVPAVGNRVEAQFGSEIALIGYDLEPTEAEPGDTIHLTLHWQALRQPRLPYTVFAHLLDETRELRAQQDNMPVHNSLPTTCWHSGEFVSDAYSITIPAYAPTGRYSIDVGMYYLPTGERLPVEAASEHSPTSLHLRPLQVR
jgi:hypothetical protein